MAAKKKATLPATTNPADPIALTKEVQAAMGVAPGGDVYVSLRGDHVEVFGVSDADMPKVQGVIDKHTGWVNPRKAKKDRVAKAKTVEELQAIMLEDFNDLDVPVPASAKALKALKDEKDPFYMPDEMPEEVFEKPVEPKRSDDRPTPSLILPPGYEADA